MTVLGAPPRSLERPVCHREDGLPIRNHAGGLPLLAGMLHDRQLIRSLDTFDLHRRVSPGESCTAEGGSTYR